jgi:phage baseplate assembly protein V
MINEEVQRGIIKLVDDSTQCQSVQVEMYAGEVSDPDVEHMQPFGLSFVPPGDSECIVLSPGSDMTHLIAIANAARTFRPKGLTEPGEGGLYSLDGAYRVFLAWRGGKWEVHLGKVDPTDRAVLGDAFKTEYDGHAHASPFGPTGGPITPLPEAVLSSTVKIG